MNSVGKLFFFLAMATATTMLKTASASVIPISRYASNSAFGMPAVIIVSKSSLPSPFGLRADPRSWDSGAMRWFGQASEHDADHGETDESGGGSCIALEVARQAAVSTDPGEGAFDDPALGKNDEAMQLVSLDDFQRPGAGLCDGCGRLRSLVAGVGEDALDEGKEAARTLVKNQSRAIAILHIGRVDDDVQQ